MNRFLTVLLVSAFVLVGANGCGQDDPVAQLRTMNELMAKDFPLTAQQHSNVERLVAEGDALISAGVLEKAGDILAEAVDVLEFAEDAVIFNKSE